MDIYRRNVLYSPSAEKVRYGTRKCAARLGMLAPIGRRLVVKCMFGIEDNVVLSASAVYASLALCHTPGNYNCQAPVCWMVTTRSLKTAFVGDHH